MHCVYLMWQKVLLKNIFDYFERIKEKYSSIKIIIIDFSLIVEKNWTKWIHNVGRAIHSTYLGIQNPSLPRYGVKKKVKLYVYKYVTKGSYRHVASKGGMVCIINDFLKFFWLKNTEIYVLSNI